jgi:hypothetical protein
MPEKINVERTTAGHTGCLDYSIRNISSLGLKIATIALNMVRWPALIASIVMLQRKNLILKGGSGISLK